MTVYIINENPSDDEIRSIRDASKGKYPVKSWPAGSVEIPADISVAILIIRETSTELEEARVVSTISKGIRIVCTFIERIDDISDLAIKYCSAKVSLSGGGFISAIEGNDRIQEDEKGEPADNNPQKRHNC
ncbi:hypothetical protein [Brucella intermedia]|uniref:hypothetical protein n=1 Tax=Brucella intermedia TaxID=94625 RepID=UPI0034CFC848